jgi:hypothetical protein
MLIDSRLEIPSLARNSSGGNRCLKSKAKGAETIKGRMHAS